jgi:hypothetical protein
MKVQFSAVVFGSSQLRQLLFFQLHWEKKSKFAKNERLFSYHGIWLLGKTGFASFTLAVHFIGNCRVAVLKNWLVFTCLRKARLLDHFNSMQSWWSHCDVRPSQRKNLCLEFALANNS